MKINISDYNATVPHNIRRILNERGMKQCVLAERAGYSKQGLTDMLKRRRIIKACDIVALSKALGCTPNDLFITNSESEGE